MAGKKPDEKIATGRIFPLNSRKKLKDFKRLLIWQKGMDIAENCNKLVKKFPVEERYSLSSQINRAALSIPANIAEGSAFNSTRQYLHFLHIALGSTYELETHLLLALRVGYGEKDFIELIITDVRVEQKMLLGFIRRIIAH